MSRGAAAKPIYGRAADNEEAILAIGGGTAGGVMAAGSVAVKAAIALPAVLVFAVLFGTVLVQAHGTDFSGKSASRVVVHPTNALSGPIAGQWNDGQTHLLPGTSVTVTIPTGKAEFLSITTSGLAGIHCSPGRPEFVGAIPTLTTSSGQTITLLASESGPVFSSTLAAGSYTLGLSAQCLAPDDVNNPGATFQISNGYVSTQVLAGSEESIASSSGTIGTQWNDGQVHFLPGTALSVTVSKSQFVVIKATGIGGISCSPSQPEFTSALPVLENSSGKATSLLGSDSLEPISPVLARGTYTVGLSAQCAPPDDVNNPGATYEVGSGYLTVQFVGD